MAQEFDGPVVVHGKLSIESERGPGTLHPAGMLRVNGNIFTVGQVEAGNVKSPQLTVFQLIPLDQANPTINVRGPLEVRGPVNTSDPGSLNVVDGSITANVVNTRETVATVAVHATLVRANDIAVIGGDIRLENGDCAEDFTISPDVDASPGNLMVLGDDGTLITCSVAYDKRVVGVISGAGSYRPGIVLDRHQHDDRQPPGGRHPIALLGKVFCRVDANHEPVSVGDLLTTSTTPGHAMRAGDASQAFGATIGKALQGLPSGTGLIPILVALQ